MKENSKLIIKPRFTTIQNISFQSFLGLLNFGGFGGGGLDGDTGGGSFNCTMFKQ